jgi:anhydro-N-acetylmuramic acid kinase
MTESNNLFIGLMSGTSLDGIDVALVEINDQNCNLKGSHFHPLSGDIQVKLASISSPQNQSDRTLQINDGSQNRIETMAELDTLMALESAKAVNDFLDINGIDKSLISAIGSHGQTVRHRPNKEYPFTIQIGDANIIAERTGIKTVADFRRMDLAAGGQGAPLAPAFHNAILRHQSKSRIILNLGGIANITYLPKDEFSPVIGFDTGPANTLMDAWFRRTNAKNHNKQSLSFDKDAHFAQKGSVNTKLLKLLKSDPYFEQSPPKSTGTEYFSMAWLLKHIDRLDSPINDADVQRTLLEFTAITVWQSIEKLKITDFDILVCGGGMHNKLLLQRIENYSQLNINTTNKFGVDGDFLEAMIFAWLAKQRLLEQPGNLPSVTGARDFKVLGAVYLP